MHQVPPPSIQAIRHARDKFDNLHTRPLLLGQHPAARKQTLFLAPAHRGQHGHITGGLHYIHPNISVQHSHRHAHRGGLLILHPHLWVCSHGFQIISGPP